MTAPPISKTHEINVDHEEKSAVGSSTELRLSSILDGSTCTPLSFREFEAFLTYREHSVENLQFWLWYEGYKNRFEQLDAEEKARSPDADLTAARLGQRRAQGTNSFNLPPSKNTRKQSFFQFGSGGDAKTHAQSGAPSVTSSTPSDNQTAELSRMMSAESSAAAQPYRVEIDRVIKTFLSDGGSKELNLSSQDRDQVISMAKHTTHPDVFAPVAAAVYAIMQTSSLPSFLQFSIENIEPPKVKFWLIVGTIDFSIGVIVALLTILLNANRGYRVFALPFFWFGSSQFYSATQGMCTQVWGRNSRQLHRWELDQMEEEKDAEKAEAAVPRSSAFVGGNSYDRQYDPTLAAEDPSRPDISRMPAPDIFGKETPVEDPYVIRAQKQLVYKILIVGTISMIFFGAIVLAVPNRSGQE